MSIIPRCIVGTAVVTVLLAAALAAAPAQRAKGGPVETGAGSTAAARKFLEGRWSLRSFEVFPSGGEPLRVSGAGTLVYDGFGNLDVEIRVDEAMGQRLAAAGVPNRRGHVSLRGRTVVDMQSRTLTYVIEGQPPFGHPSGPLALNRQRHWNVDGDVLTLTTRGENGQPLSIGRWTRVAPAS